METYSLVDYIHPNAGNFELANKICPLVVKQLSRARFEITNQNLCELRIILNDKIVEVLFDSTITIEDFNHILYGIPTEEPSLEWFRDYINKYIASYNCNGSLDIITVLREYKNSQYKSGSAFQDQLWFKIYRDTPFENGMRKLYGAIWIDYEKQLSSGDIIYDEQHTNGLWAMPYSLFKNCFNDGCMENYGDKFFVLKPLSDCQYLFDKKELIGDKYRVVAQSTLDDVKCCIPIIDQYNELLQSVWTQKKELKLECEKLKAEKEKFIQDRALLEKSIIKLIWINRILLAIVLSIIVYIGIKCI